MMFSFAATMSPMPNIVGFPPTNQIIASAFITDHALEVNPQYRIYVERIKANIPAVVDAFMAQYPRGKGTKGSPLLREFYSACYTIKAMQSRPPEWRGDGYMFRAKCEDIVKTMGAKESNLLVQFGPLTTTEIITETTWLLINKGLVVGKGFATCLTDIGIYVRNRILAKRAADARKKAAAKFGEGTTRQINEKFHSSIDIGNDVDAIVVIRDSAEDADKLRNKILAALKADALRA